MQKMLCGIKEGNKKELIEEISAYVGNYTFLCCGEEVSIEITDKGKKKSCKKCGKNFSVRRVRKMETMEIKIQLKKDVIELLEEIARRENKERDHFLTEFVEHELVKLSWKITLSELEEAYEKERRNRNK